MIYRNLFMTLIVVILSPCIASAYVIDNCNNGVITLSLGGAGTKTTPAPIMYDDFENGINGNNIADTTVWEQQRALTNTTTEYPKYSNLNQRPGSTINARFYFDVDRTLNPGTQYSDSRLYLDSGAPITDKFFISFWTRYDFGVGGDGDTQHKLFRITEGEFGSVGDSDRAIFYYFWERSTGADTWEIVIQDVDDVPTRQTPDELDGLIYEEFQQDSWTQVQVWFKGGLEGVGEIHDILCTPYSTQIQQDWVGKTLPVGGSLRWFDFGYYQGNTEVSQTAEWFFDDIYIDNSWARVLVGNNINYTDCTEFIMQVPSAWADTEITISSPPAGWLFVVNNDGVVSDQDVGTVGSQGFPIEVAPSSSLSIKANIKGASVK